MALIVPYLIDSLSTDANALRLLAQTLALGQQGISPASPGDLNVTTSGGMVSVIAAGKGVINGTQNVVTQGAYGVVNDANVSQTHSAADPTNPRNDLVGIKIEDAFYSGTNKQATPVIVTGTPASSPADPTPPANWLPLARVRVNAGASSLGTITDLRPKLSLPYKARAHANGATSIPNSALGTLTKVALQVKDWDPNVNFDVATNYRYVAPIAGYYDIKWRVSIGPATASVLVSAIEVNGVERSRCTAYVAAGSFELAPIGSDHVFLAATDYVELFAAQNSGSAQNTIVTTPDGCFLSAHYLSS